MAGGAQSDDDGMISGINVTPLVDVTLVLLIIFMVTAKMIVNQGMPMDLPKAATGQEIQTVFSVELSADGKTHVDSNPVANDEAVSALAKSAKAKNQDIRAVIRADRKVEHGRVIHVLDLLNRAGISKVAFGVQAAAAEETKPPSEGG
ncbi:MAG: biopolymer transporter ExbD [Polyangiaceae bacterium]|nr:biopolymer transporter ExbD [Polyangiaceae bacterium]MCW5791699.1 biopolymer transporter ExbD [Polyangiaceae bacterium]